MRMPESSGDLLLARMPGLQEEVDTCRSKLLQVERGSRVGSPRAQEPKPLPNSSLVLLPPFVNIL
jgi:hypothetical protein